MGVKNLWDVLEPCKKTLPLHHLQNKRICIDLSCWMVQLQCVNKSYCANKDRVYLRGLFHRVRALIGLNCQVIFVSDGSIPGIKLSTYRRRLKSRFEVAIDGINPDKVTSLKRNKGSEFSCMIKEAKLLGSALGIPCLEGVEEAEAQCALLNMESFCDACFSSDSDIFLFGARTVYREICLGEGGYVVCYEMDDIERTIGLGRNSLIALALLLGSDYNQGVNGLRSESACRIVKSIGDNVILQRVASEGLAFAKKTRTSKKHAKRLTCNNEKNSLNAEANANGCRYDQKGHEDTLQVVDAYLKPKCHSPDSDAVHRVLGEHPFQRIMLQELCGQFFEWPPEKTDEYILPKIAERNLRRYAALRSTSTELGVKLPLDKMPVKCPISEIIKLRKVQGRECFEVSWNELDGLETSIVPAELVERACHEKIMEFKDKKAMGKKDKPKLKPNRPKPTQKKPEPIGSSSSIDELGLRLRDLDIFPEDELGFKLRDLEIFPVPSCLNQSRPLVFEPTTKPDCRTASVKDRTGSCSSKCDVIDLLSPSPVCYRDVSRFEELKQRNTTVIELTDSDTEESPEHMTKAREFRMFLESIRNDLL